MSGGSFDVNFTDINSLSGTPFNNVWGDSDEHALSSNGLWLGSVGTDYTPMGIMQNPTGASAGEGYGLYSYTARYEYANQPGGDYLLLWRADNQWLDSAAPGLITEMDMLETFDNSSSAASTLHYYDSSAGSDDGYTSHNITGLNLTALNVYSMDWQAGSLTFYIDGKEIYQLTGSTVPKDYADGGSNQVMGMGAESESSPVGMYVTEAQYTSSADLSTDGGAATVMAAQIARGGIAGTVASSAPAPSSPSPSTGTGTVTDTTPITVSAPGTVKEASPGAGVTVAETITGTPNATVYEATFTSTYVAEENWIAVQLNSAGTATVNVTFEHSGDFLVVPSNTSGDAPVNGYSSAITITDATSTPASITVSAPGSVQEASVGAGVTVTETIKATGLSTVYAEVLTASGSVETGFQAVTIGSTGTGTVSLHLAKTGDYVEVVDKTGSPAVTTKSSAVTITDAAAKTPVPTTPVVTPPVTGPATPTPPAGTAYSITSITDVNNTLVVTGTRDIGAASTVRDFINGSYKGVIQDNEPDGSFTYDLAAPTAAGTYTLELTLDQSSLTASKSFTIGGTATTTAPKPTIAVSAPGSVQEASKGAGVTASETITATNLTTVYAEVLTKSGTVESGYQAVKLTNGTGTVSLHLASSGDVVQVASSLTSPVVTATSGAVTITDPVATGPVTSVPASLFSISSVTEVKGDLVIVGTRDIGEASTVREFVDGSYKGVITDNAPDGSFTYTVAAPTGAGTHTLELTLDQSNLTASMSFITTATGSTTLGTVATGTAGGTSAGGSASSGTPVASASTAPVAGGLTISNLTEDSGQLLMTGDKDTGGANTMREFVDGKYLGALHDGMADGAFSMHIADVAAGAHVLSLTLDGSSATATYDFTKEANGSVQALLPTTTSAGTLVAANHDTTLAQAA
ncbi:hypothetical protein [Lichenicoccus sp.]|uniref:hypothetical protein n=1 Tax=Lichenicoccus sp. TaxID=2781899 RepID=UPI003D0E2DD5